MNTIWVLPIEPFPLRYTGQWYRWFGESGPFATAAALHGFRVRVVDGDGYTAIRRGEFLDVLGTNRYKASQAAALFHLVESGEANSGDTILLLDGWSPIVAGLAYARDLSKDFPQHLVGLLHAGTWVPGDLLTRQLRPWSKPFEAGMLQALDRRCVATHYHAGLLQAAGGGPARVTGFPLLHEEFTAWATPWSTRTGAVFPHRLAPEKDPSLAREVRAALAQSVPMEITMDRQRSKDEYYEVLGRSRAALSCHRSETWGIAMLEAAFLGAWPVVPRAASYPEIFPDAFFYPDNAQPKDIAALVLAAASQPTPYTPPDPQRWGTPAFDAIVKECIP